MYTGSPKSSANDEARVCVIVVLAPELTNSQQLMPFDAPTRGYQDSWVKLYLVHLGRSRLPMRGTCRLWVWCAAVAGRSRGRKVGPGCRAKNGRNHGCVSMPFAVCCVTALVPRKHTNKITRTVGQGRLLDRCASLVVGQRRGRDECVSQTVATRSHRNRTEHT